MVVVLNGPLGIGKSTLAEALSESIHGCVMLDGDHLVAANPPHRNELEHLHSTVALLVSHHQAFGYRHFVVNHIWRSSVELEDLRRRLRPVDEDVRTFLLTLSAADNIARIEQRAGPRAIDDLAWERETVLEERNSLAATRDGSLGEPFDVSAPPAVLVEIMLRRLDLPARM